MRHFKRFFTLLVVLAMPLFSNFDCDQIEVTTIKSLIDPKTISSLVQKYYHLEGMAKSSILSIGVNDIYLVESGGKKYALRLSRVDKYLTMTESEFLFELEWLEFLSKEQIPVSSPIRRADNQLCGLIDAPEGPRYATLFSFGEGTTDLNEEQAFILGESLAKLHVVSDTFKTSLSRFHLDLHALVNCPVEQIKTFLGKAYESKYPFLDELAAELTKQISTLDLNEVSYGIIAGDLHGYNQNFTSDNQLTMFDFEFCAYGYQIYDIATFKWSRGSNLRLWQPFLKGYQSVRQLSVAEVQAIDLFAKARHLWWMGAMTTLPDIQHTLDNKFWNQAFRGLGIE